MRAATHAAVRLAGRLLGKDVASPGWPDRLVAVAGQFLHAVDQLDIVESEEYDRRIVELAVADPPVWLEIAESGDLDGTHYIAHVLWHHGLGGYQPGEAWIAHCMSMIAAMPQERRFEEAGQHPELVGLHRVITEMPDGATRLLAVMDRR
jgi:hypothetical protein